MEQFASFFGFADIRMSDRYKSGLPLEVKNTTFLDSWIGSEGAGVYITPIEGL